MIPSVQNIHINDWIVADRCVWWKDFYILPGTRLKIVGIPLNNNGRVRLCLNLSEQVQIFPEYDPQYVATNFSFSGQEPDGIPRQRSRYDIAKKVPPPIQTNPKREVGFEEIANILGEKLNYIRDYQINRNTRLIDDLQMDSLDGVELVLAFEDAFDIGIEDKEVEYIRTAGDVHKFIQDKVNDLI